MECYKKKVIIRFFKDWIYAVSLTILFSTLVYATCINIASQSPQNINSEARYSVKAADTWFKNTSVIRNSRKLLSGLGSSPPRCNSKCGECKPCTPVHVPVPPGTPVTAEYYPEAWRCKCGNKLYMP